MKFDEATQLCEMRVTGKLDRTGFEASELQMTDLITRGKHPRILVILEGFMGWDQQGEWNNLEFMFTHGDQIARIAVVGDPRWESEVKMFTGAGIRKTPVAYFESERINEARAWVLA